MIDKKYHLPRVQNLSYSLLAKQILRQEKHYGRKWVLFSDIDRTAYRKGVDNSSLTKQIDDGFWGLVYITGRHLHGVVELLQSGKLKKPHAVATNVGTRLYYLDENSADKPERDLTCQDFIEDNEFIKKTRNCGFSKSDVHAKGKSLIQEMSYLNPDFHLEFQEQEKDINWKHIGTIVDPFKVSFVYCLPSECPNEVKKDFIKKIKEHFKGYCTVISIALDSPQKNTWCLDVVPFAKDKAIKYLNKKMQVKGVIAGDSGNDIHMLLGQIGEATRDFLRICVGGTTHDVLEEIAKVSIRQEIASWVFRKPNQSDEFMYAYIESRKDCLGPISLARAMNEAEQAHTSIYSSNKQ